MPLRRGFKADATALAAEVRDELGIGPYDRIDPHRLAQHLGVPVVRLSDLVATCRAADHFLTIAPEMFSAATVFEGRRRMVVHNDAHSEPRQNSDLAHELSHGLLLHPPIPALDVATGCRNWNSTYEDEANWLAGALLVTPEMALATARGRFTLREAQLRLGVSNKMLRWRMNVTGANIRANRERSARSQRSA